MNKTNNNRSPGPSWRAFARVGWRAAARCALVAAALALAACASYSGHNLQPGISTADEVIGTMGQPAMAWRDADGREQLAYPRGPFGWQTFMAYIGPDGRLQTIVQVLTLQQFARIEYGRSTDQDVLRLIGPPSEPEAYFAARNELAWEWLYCDSWNQQAFFDVLFDATTRVVRSTMSRPATGGFQDVPRGCSS
jgi:hypothetical protein